MSVTELDALPDPRTDQAELAARRRAVTDLLGDLPGAGPEQLGFQHPWEIRAFAMAVSAHQELGFEWADFQQALIASISRWENDPDRDRQEQDDQWSYYTHWVAALEQVLGQTGVIDGADLDQQTQDVLAIPANRNHHEAHTEPIAIDKATRNPA